MVNKNGWKTPHGQYSTAIKKPPNDVKRRPSHDEVLQGYRKEAFDRVSKTIDQLLAPYFPGTRAFLVEAASHVFEKVHMVPRHQQAWRDLATKLVAAWEPIVPLPLAERERIIMSLAKSALAPQSTHLEPGKASKGRRP